MIKAYAAHEPQGKLQAFEYDPGALQPHEVEIDVQFCGICHSDLSVIDNEWGMTQYPVVAGHEVVGTISQIGDHVKDLKVGQTVGLGWHAGYCNVCAPCHAGDHNLCAASQATIIGHHGGFADKVRAEANSVVPIPQGIDLESAGPLFCGGVTVFNPLVQFNIQPTDKVAVIGIGGLGHMALQFLNAWGCEVTAFTSSDDKKQEAMEMGAHHTLNSRDAKAIEAAAGRFDLLISTVNVKLDWNLYLGTLKPRGRLHFVGATLEPLDINVFALIMAQRTISGSPVGSPATISKMLEFAQRHDIKPVIEKFSFDRINEAIDRLRSGKAHYRIVLHR
ncbi:NADPH-dependent aldehyde reductase Ahr [Thiobacillus denitrificans]|uniref:alcohol dehydrogenase (NADP(+)) n=1 Tax=Thiobacillus denitrificans TaxID=36861 RepID=A0A106BPR9_THIDE|nr:NAD(P)-dependent alcohol dehydrogenase [Thiobacillus denitrificans]KVW96260.1 alcohol dehydrogenase [Thiobacillus denitrificans]